MKKTHLIFVCLSIALSVAAQDSLGRDGTIESNEDGVKAREALSDFSKPSLFAYLSFEKGYVVEEGVGTLRAKDGKGGAGFLFEDDLSSLDNFTPELTVKRQEGHRAGQILLVFEDQKKGAVTFIYDIPAVSPGEEITLLPKGSRSFEAEGFDPASIRNFQLKGDWQNEPYALQFKELNLIAPSPAMLAARADLEREEEAIRERKEAEEERKRRQREELLETGVDHPEDGAGVVHVGMAGANLIGVEIIAGVVNPSEPVAYIPQEGDVKKPGKEQVLSWNEGRPALAPMGVLIERKVEGKIRKLGYWNEKAGTVWSEYRVGGELNLEVIDDPRAYRIRIDGGEPFVPLDVSRKSKPTRLGIGSGEFGGQHFLYFEVPEPPGEGAEISVEFFALNTKEEEVSFRLDSKTTRTEVLHVSHLGYRADDSFKRAYLSLWTGTGGGREFSTGPFHLLDSSGEEVYEGRIVLGMPADQSEPFVNERNHSGTDVYHLDFTGFRGEGEFRVHVPGLGVSYPFAIHEDQWAEAFEVSMHGFLSHRSGIALGPPVTDYVRPRPMHPDDGVRVFETDVVLWDGESDAIRESLGRQLGEGMDLSALKEFKGGWGGYMDAGDWDRRSQHLMASFRHLELYELFPEKMGALKLRLPASEAENELPDVIDEALWNIDFYRRLQNEDGGVRGGIESTQHPRDGEASWHETLLIGVYEADPETSYRYAAVAAKAARLVPDEERSATLRRSAVRAWDWAGKNGDEVLSEAKARGAKGAPKAEEAIRRMKVLAAAELFHLTGESRFLEVVESADKDILSEADIAMSIALLPDGASGIRAEAIQSVVSTADEVIERCYANGFNLAPGSRYLPMMGYLSIWSTPGAAMPPVLPRAHFLTGDEKYLAATLASTHYPGGANPMNMSYTTGIGARYPMAPLHIDSRVSGQEAPAGITVYGQSDPTTGYAFDSFAHTWFLNRFGGVNSKEWPTAEAYIDLGNWPAMNEYTIHQNLAPTSYTWGYLAGRPSRDLD